MSSYFDDASLVMIPSGYKTSKVYSVKPTDGTGDLTFTRSNDTASRVASNGLIEKVRTNLALQSEAFDNASWSKTTATVTANTTTAPNGTLTADKLVAAVGAGTAGQHRVEQTTVSAAGAYTFSVYAKKAETQYIFLRIGASLGAYCDLNNGQILSASSGITAKSEDAGNGWYRIIITNAAASANEVIRINLAVTVGNLNFIGNGTDGAFIWGAQYEATDFGATAYIPTTTAAVSVGPVASVPRLDYLNSSCPRLLLEGQRTNYQVYSENSAQWSTPADGLTVVYNTSETIDPSGYYGAEKVTSASGNKRMFNGLTNPSGALTMSSFVKKGTGDDFLLRTTSGSINVQYNLTTLTITATSGTGTITDYGNGWYRVTASTTSAIANEVARYQFPNADGEYMYFWGAMAENGAYATSYIPTLGAAVTRGADAASKTGISSLIGQTEGTIFLQFDNRLLTSYPNEYPLQIVGSGGHQLWLRKESGSNTFTARLIVSSSTIWTFSDIPVPNGNTKIAISYKTGDSAIYLNGTQFGSTSTAAFSGNAFADLNFNLNGTANPELILNQALLFKTRLSNSDLAALTA